jgi:hypothetical protein
MAEVITYDVTKEILNEMIASTKQLMLYYKGLQNSDLIESVEWTYRDNIFMLIANDYFQWVDSGRKPRARMVPIEALIRWIKKKNIQPRYGQTINSLAWAIRISIYKVGITPRPYTQQIIGQTVDYLSEELAVNLSIKIADAISEELTFTLGKN